MRSDSFPYFTAAVIGAGGFGAIHVRELLENGASPLFVLNSTPESSRLCGERLTSQFGKPVSPIAGIEELSRKHPQIVCICTPNSRHLDPVDALMAVDACLIIEKPFYWDNAIRPLDIVNRSIRVLDAGRGRIACHLPTRWLARSVMQALDVRGSVSDLKFRYWSRGPYRFDEIGIDLLPHGLSALLEIVDTENNCPENIRVRSAENDWSCWFAFGDVAVHFDFRQDPSLPESILEFEIDQVKIRRHQTLIDNVANVYLSVGDSDPFIVGNPISQGMFHLISAALAGDDAPFQPEVDSLIVIVESMASIMSGSVGD